MPISQEVTGGGLYFLNWEFNFNSEIAGIQGGSVGFLLVGCVHSTLIIKSGISISETCSMAFGYEVLFRKACLSLCIHFNHIKINTWAAAAWMTSKYWHKHTVVYIIKLFPVDSNISLNTS